MVRAGLAALIAAFALGAVQAAWGTPRAPSAGRPVLLVPMGAFPPSDATKLARYIRARSGVETGVAPRAHVPRAAFDRGRKQYVAETLVDSLLARPELRRAVLIGLTLEDMYAKNEPWRFTFSIRNPGGLAVVSRARMDPRMLGLAPDPALRMRRLQKMVLKNVGSLALGRPLSGNARSVMFGSILGVDDLDYMTEDFRPQAPSRATRAWLVRTNGICTRGISREKALLARSSPTTPEEALAQAREYLDLREQQRSELAAVPPPEDRASYRALLTKFGKANRADRAAVAALEARWNESGVRSWAKVRVSLGFALKAAALELGSRACGRYFDPFTYG